MLVQTPHVRFVKALGLVLDRFPAKHICVCDVPELGSYIAQARTSFRKESLGEEMTAKNRYSSASSEYFSDNEQAPPGDKTDVEDEQTTEKGETDVWDNLNEIFKDLDAHKEKGENKLLLQKQILHLRRLLEIHEDMQMEEAALEKAHLGVMYEREWYLRKLEALELAIGPFLLVKQPGGGGKNKQATTALGGAIRAILYEPSKDANNA